MAKYYVGTAGWSYEDWDGIVYPVRKGAGFHALSFLADFINIVEVNSTFYRPAPPAMVRSWLKRIEDRPDFMLALKLYQAFTHAGEGFTKKDVEDVRLAADLVHLQGRLAALLVQFPWSFRNTSENTDYLERLFELFAGLSPGRRGPSRELGHARLLRPPRRERGRLLQHRPAAVRGLDQAVGRQHEPRLRLRPPPRPEL